MQAPDPDEIRRMLAAHVAYERARYDAAHLHATVAEEVAWLWRWLAATHLNALMTPAQASAWVARTANAVELPEAARSLLRENLAVALETLQETDTQVDALLPRAVFDQWVESIAGMGRLRQEITHQVVSSSVYTMLIADVLYRGIKDFVLTENMLAKNIPGASSFVRLGQNALNAAAPQFEKNVDRQLTAFINANLQNSVLESERFLNKAVDGELVRKLADEVWTANAATPLSTPAGLFEGGESERLLQAAETFWRHFRQTALFGELIDGAVRSLFLRYGKKDLRTLLADFGVDEARAVEFLSPLAGAVAEQALASGVFEAYTRARLAGFYTAYAAGALPAQP